MIKWFVPFVKITVFCLPFICVHVVYVEIHMQLHECMHFDLRWILYKNTQRQNMQRMEN